MKILTVSDIKDSKNLLGCFGYFGEVLEDLIDLEDAFYGQLTEFPLDSFFGTPDSDCNDVRKFMFFVPESSLRETKIIDESKEESKEESKDSKIEELSKRVEVLEEKLNDLVRDLAYSKSSM